MKNKIALTIVALGLTMPALNLNAQDGPRPPRGPGGPGGPRGDGPRGPAMPLIAVLDTNRDGVIDSSELAAAVDSLKTLDKNGDGKLTRDELRTVRPQGAGDVEHSRPQREQTGPDGADQPNGHRPGPPIVAALDANKDGVIDATELANASAALKALDKNADGKLSREELHPRGLRRDGNGDRPRGRRPQPDDRNQQ